MPLGEALDVVKKIHDANRTNPIDREAAAKEMGYTGISGRSAKVLSDLSHFGLLEKVGSGQVRVSRRAVEILYPESEEARREALHDAADSPTLFAELNSQFADGLPSDNALRSYLMRNGFASAAIPPVMKSYLETYRALEQKIASPSHGLRAENYEESTGYKSDASTEGRALVVHSPPPPIQASPQSREIPLMEGERVVFVEEADAGRYLKLVAAGALDDNLLEALEDFTKRQRKRLVAARPKESGIAEPKGPAPGGPEEAV
ncbi:hypothetical protein [Phenylobacterium sp.]|uniref:hypothetical protein n=1 Tax=Phenylobacterium sp. TaxID=1871053 RepID=UPI0012278A41|nr:hypothetical protein [Phenylobacterium sp.]THD58555.1 MAG: hypothetical protein E8A49_18700 [Phenylobacterium sp.]